MDTERFSALVKVFEDAMTAVSQPDNDFSWSGWEGRNDALAEMGAELRVGSMPDRLQIAVLFAPTGPLQELSMSSGWARAFLELADRFDRELIRLDS
ncbi:hypothetical protein ACIPPQ_01565 [Sphingopyxis sp. LARHCG72]